MRVKYMTVYEGQQYNLSQYPNFHKSGSVRGMKKQFYGKDALIVRSGSYYYNVPEKVYNAAH